MMILKMQAGLLCLCAMAILFGDSDAINTNQLTGIGVLAGGFTLMTGLMAWVLKRLLDVTIPSLQTTFSTALESQRATFTSSLERQLGSFQTAQDNFQKIVEDCQKSYKDDMDKERAFYREIFKTAMTQFQSDEREDRAKFISSLSAIADRVKTYEK